MNHQTRLERYQDAVQHALEGYLPKLDTPQAHVQEAMRYSLLSPGKRIRPMLTLEIARACGGNPDDAMPFACALEMIHCYSLIHDDLPCMDNDDERRGRPTNHRVYGEAFALLAGDGLLTAAFATALGSALPSDAILAGARALASAAGVDGMLGGQAVDVQNDGKLSDLTALVAMYGMKTGALFTAAGELGCIAAAAPQAQFAAARRYTAALGLAFQLRDDLLDMKQDAVIGKTTYPLLVGADVTRARIDLLTGEAKSAAREFRDPEYLIWLVETLAGREK